MDYHRARVLRGAEWMDEMCPGWENKVDLGRLKIHSNCHCVVGQCIGHWGLARRHNIVPHGKDQALGLRGIGDEPIDSLADSISLTKAWKELILARREAKVPALDNVSLTTEAVTSG